MLVCRIPRGRKFSFLDKFLFIYCFFTSLPEETHYPTRLDEFMYNDQVINSVKNNIYIYKWTFNERLSRMTI